MDLIEVFKKGRLSQALEIEKTANIRRIAFVTDFPRESIDSIPMDKYLFAKEGYRNSGSFCRRIHYDLEDMASIGDIWSNIFGLYLKDGTQLVLSKTFSKKFGEDYETAFTYIKKEIVNLLNAVNEDNYAAIENCELNSSFRYKLMMIYFPDKLVPVCTKGTLDDYCMRVGLTFNPNEEMIYRNFALIDWKNSVPEISEWSNAILMSFCDWLRRSEKKIDGNALQKESYVRIAKKLTEEIEELHLEGESKKAVIKRRVNQGIFRDRLLQRYNKCCLCGVSNPALLVASHI